MKALLISADSKAHGKTIENLALRKIGGYLKEGGHQVYYNNGCDKPDRVYISCIFAKNEARARETAKRFSCPVELGGYGISDAQLPPEIEHHMPDYEGMDYSEGYTSRGCFRNCPWCIVPKMEGPIRDHAPIGEFLHPDHNKLVLLDNNFQASPRWRENLQYIIDHGIKVSLNQGLDIRLIDEEIAGMLADCKYYNIGFKERRLYFAFDTPDIKQYVRRGVETLKKAGVPPSHNMFYFLCGYGVTPETYDFGVDYHRFEVLLELGVDPYVMKYNGRTDIPILNYFSRWVNKRDYKRKSPKYLNHNPEPYKHPHEWADLQKAIAEVCKDGR